MTGPERTSITVGGESPQSTHHISLELIDGFADEQGNPNEAAHHDDDDDLCGQ